MTMSERVAQFLSRGAAGRQINISRQVSWPSEWARAIKLKSIVVGKPASEPADRPASEDASREAAPRRADEVSRNLHIIWSLRRRLLDTSGPAPSAQVGRPRAHCGARREINGASVLFEPNEAKWRRARRGRRRRRVARGPDLERASGPSELGINRRADWSRRYLADMATKRPIRGGGKQIGAQSAPPGAGRGWDRWIPATSGAGSRLVVESNLRPSGPVESMASANKLRRSGAGGALLSGNK